MKGCHMRKALLVSLFVFPIAAVAQAPQSTPMEQALTQQLNQKMNEAIMVQAQLIATSRELEADKARIADLEKKLAEATKTPPLASATH